MWRKRFKRKSSGRRIKIFLLTGLVLIVAATFFLNKSNLFVIKKIDITINNASCTDENQLKNSVGVLGQNFFLVNSNNIEKNIKAKFICIKNIDLSLVFPDRAKIQVTSRQPVASLASLKSPEATTSSFLETISTPSAGLSQENYLMDEEGIIFSKDPGRLNIPNIYFYNNNLFLGKKMGGAVANGIKVLNKVKMLGLDIKTSVIWDNYFIIFSYPKLVFQLDDKTDIQLASLQLILDKAKIDLKEVAFIDLRFDKPVVKFAPKK